ncbi:hypothetical protein [Chromobacterium sp. CV08]|uniref:hypothetical protein n=1 Tax=Chromobacterium sp. CV08 TaxID=3133274 RepID=UPI003DAA0D1E
MKYLWIIQGVFSSIIEIFKDLNKGGRRMLLFMLPTLLVIALLLAVISSSGILAPFLYPLF